MDAVAAARAVLGDVDATLDPVQDSHRVLIFQTGAVSPSAVVGRAGDAVRRGVVVVVEWEHEGVSVLLRTQPDGTWIVDGDIAGALPHLEDVEPHARLTTQELLGGGGDGELDVAERVSIQAELDKTRWSEPIAAETGRTVWIGPTAIGFARWLAESMAEHSVRVLFGSGEADGRAGALVLLADWRGDATASEGSLIVGGLDARPAAADAAAVATAAQDPPELRLRLGERNELDQLPRWRAISVDPEPIPEPLHGPLTRILGITAARLIAKEEVRDRLRPSAEEPTLWPTLPDPPGWGAAEVGAVVGLARWLAKDFSQARLDAARHLAATSLPDPFAGDDARPLIETADVTYHLMVHQDVLKSLEHQQKLEEAFHALDDKVEGIRTKLGDTLDATLTKVLGAALAIAIAALASAQVRDLPATIAAAVLAGYLAWSAATLSRWFRKDAEERLDAAAQVAGGRLEGVGANLGEWVPIWKKELSRRVTVASRAMYVLAAVLFVGGLIADSDIRRAVGIEGHQPPRVVHKQPAPRPVDGVWHRWDTGDQDERWSPTEDCRDSGEQRTVQREENRRHRERCREHAGHEAHRSVAIPISTGSTIDPHSNNSSTSYPGRLPTVNTTVGFSLLGAAAFFAVLGFVLSLLGLDKVKAAAETATDAGKATSKLVTQAQDVVARAEGADAASVASANKQALDKTSELTDAVGGVEEALRSLTGVFVPARVFMAIALLLIVASFFPLGVLTVSASGGSATTGSPTATTSK